MNGSGGGQGWQPKVLLVGATSRVNADKYPAT